MRIIKIETFQGNGGLRTLHFLKITTDQGIVGWSEFADGSPGLAGLTAVIGAIAGHLLGKDPRQCARLVSDLYAPSWTGRSGLHGLAIAALENACLDVKARILQVPVYDLFGGALRDTIPVYWSQCGMYRIMRADLCEQHGLHPIHTLADVEALGTEVRERGFHALKTKLLLFGSGQRAAVHMPGFAPVGRGPALNLSNSLLVETRELLSAFRRGAGPDVEIMIDANFNFRSEGFTRLARSLEPHNVRWLEVDMEEPKALATVRRSTSTAIGSLESVLGARRFLGFLEERAVDVGIIDVMWNGFSESLAMARMADAFDTSISLHHYTGPLAAIMSAHLAAIIPNLTTMELEVDGALWGDRLLKQAPRIVNGLLQLPQAPGWGCELDEAALERRTLLQ